jgi:7,8-dihydropterin-6-yl-methyl-4-(beta-D-ribofuranosyl)aminobenzene 5'-phosphate synthase
MIRELRITVLAENTAGVRNLLAEHGLALWIEANGTNILFDTGQGLVLNANAKALGIDIGKADVAVLSHGHYDHTGGLEKVLPDLRHATLYVHPRAFDAKYAMWDDGISRDIGSTIRSVDQIRPHVAEVITTTGPTQVSDSIWVSGEIPRRNDFEDTGGPFFLDESCTKPDPLIDDQALYIESAEGVVVLTGCGHSGLVNTLDHASELTGHRKIHAVYGGLHLVGASDERIARTVEALTRFDVRRIGPAHCTGRQATARLWEAFPDRCVECRTGARFVLGIGARQGDKSGSIR